MEDVLKENILDKLDWAISYVKNIKIQPDIAKSEANMDLLIKGLINIEKEVKEY